MKKISLLLIFISIALLQACKFGSYFSSNICPKDFKGYKTEYLTEYLKPVKKEKATYKHYLFCDDGVSNFPIRRSFNAAWKIEGLPNPSDTLIPLDGDIKIYRKGKLIQERNYDKGYLQQEIYYSYKGISDTTFMADYTKLYKYQEGSLYVSYYEDDKSKRHYYYGMIKNKWRFIPTDTIKNK